MNSYGNCSPLTFENANLTELVRNEIGERCLEPRVITLTEVIYSIILVCGFTGNFCTCLVIARNASMHNATNYYLFSLAVSDLISLILGLPFELYSVRSAQYPYEMPLLVCKSRAFITEMTSYASVLTIMAFSVERWLAICFPFKFQKCSKLSRAVKVIAVIWVIAFLSAFPVWYYHTINTLGIPNEIAEVFGLTPSANSSVVLIPGTELCYLDWSAKAAHDVIINVSFWVFFMLPMCLMVYLYAYIGLTILRADRMQRGDAESQKHCNRQSQSRKVIIRMLVAVVTVFFICWLPFHLQRLATVYVSDEMTRNSKLLEDFLRAVYYISGYFYYSNSALNPLLYSILNKRFRVYFLKTLCFWLPKRFQDSMGTSYPTQLNISGCGASATNIYNSRVVAGVGSRLDLNAESRVLVGQEKYSKSCGNLIALNA